MILHVSSEQASRSSDLKISSHAQSDDESEDEAGKSPEDAEALISRAVRLPFPTLACEPLST